MKIFKSALILFFGYSCLASASEPADQAVLHIGPGSRYEQIGLKRGDRIISYDNHAVNSVQDSMEMYNKLGNNEINYMAIERDGKKVIVAVKGHIPPPPPMEYDAPKKMKKMPKTSPSSESEQTRCVPWRDPNTGDITGTDCETIDSERKAMELYNTMKTTGATQLGTERQ